MVFDLPKFEKYSWGREAFKRLIASVKRVNLNANSYTLDGFVQTLQVWAYNVVPSLGAKIGRPSNIDGPPIMKFKGLKGTNNIDINLVSVADTVCEKPGCFVLELFILICLEKVIILFFFCLNL